MCMRSAGISVGMAWHGMARMGGRIASSQHAAASKVPGVTPSCRLMALRACYATLQLHRYCQYQAFMAL